MNSIKLFSNFFAEAYRHFFKDLNLYIGSFLAFFILDLGASIPWTDMGYESNSFYEIVLSLVTAFLSLIVIANVVLIEKSRVNFRPKEDLLYAAPTYLIYTLYSSLAVLAGFLLLIIPGVLALIFLSLVPATSILIENDNVNYFKFSYRLVRQNVGIVLCFLVMTFLLEVPGLLLSYVPILSLKLGLIAVYALLDAALLVILTIVSVRIFYYLKNCLRASEEA